MILLPFDVVSYFADDPPSPINLPLRYTPGAKEWRAPTSTAAARVRSRTALLRRRALPRRSDWSVKVGLVIAKLCDLAISLRGADADLTRKLRRPTARRQRIALSPRRQFAHQKGRYH